MSLSRLRALIEGKDVGIGRLEMDPARYLVEKAPWLNGVPLSKISEVLLQNPEASMDEILNIIWNNLIKWSVPRVEHPHNSLPSMTSGLNPLGVLPSVSRSPANMHPESSLSGSKSPSDTSKGRLYMRTPFVSESENSSEDFSPVFPPSPPYYSQDSVFDFDLDSCSITSTSPPSTHSSCLDNQQWFNKNKSIQSIAEMRQKKLKAKGGKFCSFCFRNNESEMVVISHNLRSVVNGTSRLTCPVLRKYVCPACKGTGDDAHTITYCPLVITKNGHKRPTPIAYSLNSCRRYAPQPKPK